MTLPEPRDHSRFVGAKVEASRVDRAVGAAFSAERRRRRVVVFGGAGALALAAGLALWLAFGRTAPPVTATALPASAPAPFVLPDGARVTPRAASDVRVDLASRETVALTVERGGAEFVVPHLDSRRFVVHAGPFDVVDVGTTFTVDIADGHVRVAVREGSVEVRRDGELVRAVGTSETWDGVTDAPASSVAPPLVSASGSASAAVRSPAPPIASVASAKDLMAQADEARVSGRPRDAAIALDTLRRKWRTDPRAGIAAFELGRLRLDALGDPKGAVEALDDAIALAPNASFREDAEARRIEALDRSRDGRCAAARAAYAGRYPSGVHAVDVANRCRW